MTLEELEQRVSEIRNRPLTPMPVDEQDTPTRQAALSAALRRKEDMGQLFQLTGDKVLAPLGKQFLESAEQGTERQESARNRRLQLGIQGRRDEEAKMFRDIDDVRALFNSGETKDWHEYQKEHPTQIFTPGPGGEMQASIQRANTGITPSQPQAPGGGPLKKGQPMNPQDIEAFKEVVQQGKVRERLGSTFRDDFASSGLLSSLASGPRLALGRMAGAGAPETKGNLVSQSQDAVNWWADFDRYVNLPERNKLFGASLTALEKQAWEDAKQIKPNASPKVIRAALTRLMDIAANKPTQIKAELQHQGFDIGDFGGSMPSDGPSKGRVKVSDGKETIYILPEDVAEMEADKTTNFRRVP